MGLFNSRKKEDPPERIAGRALAERYAQQTGKYQFPDEEATDFLWNAAKADGVNVHTPKIHTYAAAADCRLDELAISAGLVYCCECQSWHKAPECTS